MFGLGNRFLNNCQEQIFQLGKYNPTASGSQLAAPLGRHLTWRQFGFSKLGLGAEA